MGWFGNYPNRESIRRKVTTDYSRRSCWSGNVLWVCYPGHIGCILVERQKQGLWYYKPMDETMMPYRWTCPLSYLEAVPCPPHGQAAEWRRQVRHFQAQRAIRLADSRQWRKDRKRLLESNA